MLIHPELLPDVLSLLIPTVAGTSLAWWRSAVRCKRLAAELEQAQGHYRQLRHENGQHVSEHASRWTTLKDQYQQTDLLYRSEEHLANRLAEFVDDAAVTLRRQSRHAAAIDSPYGVVYDGERCQPARIKARLDEMKASAPRQALRYSGESAVAQGSSPLSTGVAA